MKRMGLIVAAVLGLGAAADAQLARGQGTTLAPADVKKGLFGIDMWGYSPTYRMSWRECIDTRGNTIYHTPDGIRKGKLRVTEQGYACFAYEDDNYKSESCYVVQRNGKGFLFDGGGVFVTTRVTPVNICTTEDLTS